jgi:hypothetical protein
MTHARHTGQASVAVTLYKHVVCYNFCRVVGYHD